MLSINTNLSSLIAQSSMKTSTDLLNQAVERMTTGYKINHAKDNAANYSISTNMTTKIGAYMVAEDNVLQGLDMINTASESLSLIEDKLVRLRALATQASNGTYGDKSLSAINAEANALVDELGRTYSTAEYNGVKVFKGTAKIEIPDGVGTTGNVGVQTAATYSMRATSYGNFLADPYTYEQSYVDGLTAVSEVVQADGFTKSEYKIATVDDLVALAELTNAGIDTSGVMFILAKDLDIGAYCDAEIAAGNGGWTPIGNSTNRFKGTFDGNGHVIKNLKIDRNADYQGFFGYTDSGSKIKNVGLEGGSVKGKGQVGGLVGYSSSSLTNNCYATGTVSGSGSYVGGLIGRSASSITNCYATGNVTGTSSSVGGLVGVSNSSISNSYATGNVTGTSSSVGGLVGFCNNTINNCYATGIVSGTSYVGGLVGQSSATMSSSASISNSYATGNVTGTDSVGGLVGYSYYSTFSCSISNSYAAGNVTGTNSVGGLVGNSLAPYSSASSSIVDSYARGNVSGTDSVGGLVGNSSGSSSLISNSYVTGTVIGNSFVGGLIGKTQNTSGTTSITNCLSYSTASGSDSFSTGNLLGGTVVTADNTTFGTINISGCQTLSSNNNTIGGSYMYASSTYTLLDTYDMSAMLAGISPYKAPITSVTLQVGTSAPSSNQITFDMAFELDGFNNLSQIGIDTTTDFVGMVDNLLSIVSAKQTEYGAVQNRLESALEEISTQYENLVSSRSTIRDADIAEVSSHYIQQQILQQASATLMATANQSPSIALQLI